jgi:hypothetical protein
MPANGRPPVPLGLQVHPTQPILYVGFVLAGEVGVYTYDPAGHLTFVRAVTDVGDPVDGLNGAGPCWLLVNAAGTRLYISNNFDNTVVVFDLTNPLNPVQIQRVVLAQGAGNASPFQLALDTREDFLHVVTQAVPGQNPLVANGLNVLRVAADGTLKLADFMPLPSTDGSRPQGVAAKSISSED